MKAFLPVKEFVADQYIVMVTKHGVIKKSRADRVRQPDVARHHRRRRWTKATN